MPMEPLPDLTDLSLADIARLAAEKRLPPVEKWNPDHCGDSEMRIARDGTWFHQESPIGREAMVRLFSTILRREGDGAYVLPSLRSNSRARAKAPAGTSPSGSTPANWCRPVPTMR